MLTSLVPTSLPSKRVLSLSGALNETAHNHFFATVSETGSPILGPVGAGVWGESHYPMSERDADDC